MDTKPAPSDPLLQPFKLRHLHLKNRVMSTAHAPAYAEDGHPRDRYRLYHEEKARGGLALTMIGGSTNVSPDSPSVFGQLYAGDDSIVPWFQKLTSGVKAYGAAVMCQLTHMGRRTGWDSGDWLPVIGASGQREQAHRAIPKAAEVHDLARVSQDFAAAAKRCQDGGFDGIELLSHAHLLGQFLSPQLNDRDDHYGGGLDNRLRLTLEVLDAVRQAVGPDFIVGLRVTADELSPGGMQAQEGALVAQKLEATGQVDFLNVLGGQPYDDLGLAGWVPPMGHRDFLKIDAFKSLREATNLPLIFAGGINDLATARHALREGLVEMVGMTRAHMADPYLVQKILGGDEERIRPCVGLGYCVDRVNQGKDAVCGQNAVTGREGFLSHRPLLARKARRIVIVGGGPGGLEAARLAAAARHDVTLFEASDKLGGQLLLASKGEVRRQIEGVRQWLVDEVSRAGVRLELGTYAQARDVAALAPDLVIDATGGYPAALEVPGGELASSAWDVLARQGENLGTVLLWDQIGDQPGAVAADFLSRQNKVIWATPDGQPLAQLGPTNQSVAKRHLYGRGVEFRCDVEIERISEYGNMKQVRLRNILTGHCEDLVVDQVVIETGTQPLGEPYGELVNHSRNLGEIDLSAFARGQLRLPNANPDAGFDLVRIGDAVASRNLHAALFDANRVIQGLDQA